MTAGDLARALEAAGYTAGTGSAPRARFDQLLAAMANARSGGDRDGWAAWYVPGRIEVLGKHTDYGGGRSLLCAAERGFHVVSAARADRRLSLTDLGRGTSLVLDADGPRPEASWATYPLTVLRRLSSNFPELGRGVDVVFESDLPSAAGMSSSSALMVAVLLALVHANRLDETTRWIENVHPVDIRQSAHREDLAAYAATIENGQTFRALVGESGVGTEGGSEDHTAILCSRPMALSQYAFCPTRHERSVAFPPGLVFAIGASGVAARKTGQARDDYNRASRLAARVLERWRADTGREDASLAAALSSSSGAPGRLRALLGSDVELLDRFEQFFEESTALVPTAADELARGDLPGFGRTVARSQQLAEERLHNQVPETVTLARTAREHGAWAASAFGAGFGGSVWALVDQADAHAFLDRWQNAYTRACPAAAARSRFFLTKPGPGVVRLSE